MFDSADRKTALYEAYNAIQPLVRNLLVELTWDYLLVDAWLGKTANMYVVFQNGQQLNKMMSKKVDAENALMLIQNARLMWNDGRKSVIVVLELVNQLCQSKQECVDVLKRMCSQSFQIIFVPLHDLEELSSLVVTELRSIAARKYYHYISNCICAEMQSDLISGNTSCAFELWQSMSSTMSSTKRSSYSSGFSPHIPATIVTRRPVIASSTDHLIETPHQKTEETQETLYTVIILASIGIAVLLVLAFIEGAVVLRKYRQEKRSKKIKDELSKLRPKIQSGAMPPCKVHGQMKAPSGKTAAVMANLGTNSEMTSSVTPPDAQYFSCSDRIVDQWFRREQRKGVDEKLFGNRRGDMLSGDACAATEDDDPTMPVGDYMTALKMAYLKRSPAQKPKLKH